MLNKNKNYSLLEIHLYDLRHIQLNTAILNLIFRQTINKALNWVGQAKEII